MIDIDELIKLCLEFDRENKMYPEHEFEGKAFYLFVIEKLKLDKKEAEKEYDEMLGEISKIEDWFPCK
jgi:MoaA/NifB/PqqE/SkfB family radical SAM enzyme